MGYTNTKRLNLSTVMEQNNFKNNMEKIDEYAYIVDKKTEGLSELSQTMGYVYFKPDSYHAEIKRFTILDKEEEIPVFVTRSREKTNGTYIYNYYTKDVVDIDVDGIKVTTKILKTIPDYQGFNYAPENDQDNYEPLVPELSPPFNSDWSYGDIMVKKVIVSSGGNFEISFLKYAQSLGGYYRPIRYLSEDSPKIEFERVVATDAKQTETIDIPERVLNDVLQTFLWNSGDPDIPIDIFAGYTESQIPSINYKVYKDTVLQNGEQYEEVDVYSRLYWNGTKWILEFQRVNTADTYKIFVWKSQPEEEENESI